MVKPQKPLEVILLDLHFENTALLNSILKKLGDIMATLKDVKDKVAAESTVVDSAIVLLKALAQKVADLAPNQADIDALAAEIEAKTGELAAAVTENTPAE